MNEQPRQGEEVVGPNPNYKGLPLKRWHTVECVAKEHTEFGVIEDSVDGVLTIIVRRQGEQWPHGMKPECGVNTIVPGARVYCVVSDDHGPDMKTWKRFASYCRSCALSGESNPLDFEQFVAKETCDANCIDDAGI